MIQANCRARFTAEDFSFVVRTLARSAKESVSLSELLSDQETRDTVLDHDTLLQAILEGDGQLSISPQFYFYVLVRQVLKQSQFKSRELSDYLASLLENFSRAARLGGMHGSENSGGPVTPYLSDMLLALRRASHTESFHIRAHVGNCALFISGIFHENIQARSERGAPDFSFYEGMGSQSFRVAADHKLARQCELSGVYHELAEGFHSLRKMLNRLSDEYIHLGDEAHIPPLIHP